jgi:hypothetical protein
VTHKAVDFGPVHLADQGPLAAGQGFALGLDRRVVLSRAVAPHLPADGTPVPTDLPGDLGLRFAGLEQLRYPFPFVHGKLTGHRWDSVRTADGFETTIEPPSDFFTKASCSPCCVSDQTTPDLDRLSGRLLPALAHGQ